MNNLFNNDFKFKKRFGQNFLKDKNILSKIIKESHFEKDSLVLEIGCGCGYLTEVLVENGYNVLGYEVDKTLTEVLKEKENKNFKVIIDDFLNRNITEDIKDYCFNKIYAIGNIPYYITTPIIEKLINSGINFNSIILMVQKEVAERITSLPNNKSYGSLTVYLNYNYDIKNIMNVDKKSFFPVPKVDSSVIMFCSKEKIKVLDELHFYRIIRKSFSQKRKTLKNNLKEYNFDFIKEVLNKYGFDDKVRAEQIPINLFAEISNYLITKNC